MHKPLANPLGQGAGEQAWGALLLLWLVEAGGCQQSRAVPIPQLLAEKPKINISEGSENKFPSSQDYQQRPLPVLGWGGSFFSSIEPPGRQRGPGRERISAFLCCPFTCKLPAAHQPCCSVPVLPCTLWAPSLAPALLAPLLMAPTPGFDPSRVLWLELCLCCL